VVNDPPIEQVSPTVNAPVKFAENEPGPPIAEVAVPLNVPLPLGPALFVIVKVPLTAPATSTLPVTRIVFVCPPLTSVAVPDQVPPICDEMPKLPPSVVETLLAEMVQFDSVNGTVAVVLRTMAGTTVIAAEA
jgi:hypothetical protein